MRLLYKKLQFGGTDIDDIEIIEDGRLLYDLFIELRFGQPAHIA
jgi:hypothetical protein